MKSLTVASALIATLAVAPVKSAEAGPGARVGITDDPDTLFLGLHWLIDLAPAGPGVFNLRPGLDFGLGLDDPIDFMIKGAAHFAWEVPVSGQFVIYPLIGPSVTYLNFDSGIGDGSETDLGVDIGFGFKFSRYAIELWLGLRRRRRQPGPVLRLRLHAVTPWAHGASWKYASTRWS